MIGNSTKVILSVIMVTTLSVMAVQHSLEPEPEQGNVWNIYIVDPIGNAGWYTSTAVDPQGNPHISYHDTANKDLKYAKWTGSLWHNETVDSVGSVGEENSIALDNNGNPHMSYVDYTNGNIKHANWTGISWDIETVDTGGAGIVAHDTSIDVDSNGYAHVSYFDTDNLDLKYAKWTGNIWSIEIVESTGQVGWHTSIALDSGDSPHIAYYDHTGGDLKYANWTGISWDIETVDTVDNVGLYTSIALDSSDNPHISYSDITNGDIKYANWTGSTWNTEVVDPSGPPLEAVDTAIALDSNDIPHISYFDSAVDHLRCAIWTGSTWNIETVDTAKGLGWGISIALDNNDNPHVSYYNRTSGALKHATKAELGPSPEPLLSYSPPTLDFGILPPSSIASGMFEVWNSGNSTLTYSFSKSLPWITGISPPNGSSTGEHDAINVTIDTTGLSEGVHTGSIFIESNGGDGTVNISLYVLAASRSIFLDIDPDTLNLKSRGRWITAYLSTENASVYDIDMSSIRLQDTLIPERWDYQDDVLMLKFNRQEFKNTVVVGESIDIKISGKWKDGTDFEAYDYIRVIDPGH